jgi:uncharacterized protein YqjF (DUF2071 family)
MIGLRPAPAAPPLAAAPARRVWPAQPFAMAGVVCERFLLTYRVEPRLIRALAPGPFDPVVRDGVAFAGVCLVEVRDMRPERLPAWLGFHYHEAVYRLIVEYDSPTAGPLRGIVAPRSDANHPAIALGGRLLSHYPFHLARIDKQRHGDHVALRQRTLDGGGDVDATFLVDPARRALPAGSAFASLDEAMDLVVGMRHTFAWRGAWDGRQAVVHRSSIEHGPWRMSVALPERPPRLAFFESPLVRRYGGAELDHVLHMRDVPHVWGATQAETLS